MCYEFQNAGHCKWGEGCRFSHCMEAATTGASAQETEAGREDEECEFGVGVFTAAEFQDCLAVHEASEQGLNHAEFKMQEAIQVASLSAEHFQGQCCTHASSWAEL